MANSLEQRSILSVGKTLLLPNPTKDPNKKVIVKVPEKKPVAVVKTVVPAVKKVVPVAVQRNAPNTQKTISYGGYSLDLKVEK